MKYDFDNCKYSFLYEKKHAKNFYEYITRKGWKWVSGRSVDLESCMHEGSERSTFILIDEYLEGVPLFLHGSLKSHVTYGDSHKKRKHVILHFPFEECIGNFLDNGKLI